MSCAEDALGARSLDGGRISLSLGNRWIPAACVRFAARPIADGPAGKPARRDFTPADLTI